MLNILPESKKKQIEQERLHRLVRVCSLLVAITFVSIDLVLFGIRFGLDQWGDKVNNARVSTAISDEVRLQVEDQIKEITSTLIDLNSVDPENNPLPIISTVLTDTPENVFIHSVSIQLEDGEVNIKGIVQDRDTFISVQDHYRARPEFESIEFPVGDLTVREQIPFIATASLHEEYTLASEEN